jgi:hypothetical protein
MPLGRDIADPFISPYIKSTNLQRRNNKIQKTKRIEEMLNVVFPYNCKKMFFMSRHVS